MTGQGKRYNIGEAKVRLEEILDAVGRGERVTICRRGTPVAECVPVRPFPFGVWAIEGLEGRDLSHMADPTDDDLLDDMDF